MTTDKTTNTTEPQQPLRIAVISGGSSREAEVSRVSGQGVAAALRERGHAVTILELDQQLPTALLELAPDVVFPALHGAVGEDGTIQGFLEIVGLPYVGSNVHGSSTAMDKTLAKHVFRSAGLPVATELSFDRWPDDLDPASLATRLLDVLGDRLVIKPRTEGSALGVLRLHGAAAVAEALDAVQSWTGGWLAEPFVDGIEATVGVLDLAGRSAATMPPIEIVTAAGEWYDYTNRYAAGKSEHIIPARLPAAVNDRLQVVALAAHRALGLRDLSRSDFIVRPKGELVLLETNTMPGMTPTSLYPDGAQALGYRFPELLEALCTSALRRSRSQDIS
ncbi:MAG: D-alanine--D-alanine ligase [Pseudomonadota bacterium]